LRQLGHDALQSERSSGYDLLNSSVVWGSVRSLVHLAEIAMQIKVDPSVIGQTRWSEYAIRFLFGGLITAVAGIIAKDFGPGIGGLFLAFPAIFPASATLIEKHETQKKEEKGLRGTRRGREAASVDAAGSAMGSVGLLVFALIVWQFAPSYSTSIMLMGATVAWLTVSVLIWYVRKQV
jgi:Protein of unknown function (DUF3147)